MLLCLSPSSAFKTEINYPQPVKKQLTVAIIAFLVLVEFEEERVRKKFLNAMKGSV